MSKPKDTRQPLMPKFAGWAGSVELDGEAFAVKKWSGKQPKLRGGLQQLQGTISGKVTRGVDPASLPCELVITYKKHCDSCGHDFEHEGRLPCFVGETDKDGINFTTTQGAIKALVKSLKDVTCPKCGTKA